MQLRTSWGRGFFVIVLVIILFLLSLTARYLRSDFTAQATSSVYPGTSWDIATPESMGFDPVLFQQAMNSLPSPAVVIRGGKIVGQKGDITRPGWTWSGSKSLAALIAARQIQLGNITYDTIVPGSDFPYAPTATYRQFMSMTSDFGLDPHQPEQHFAYNNGGVTHYCDHIQQTFYFGQGGYAQDFVNMLKSAILDTTGSEDPVDFSPYCSGWGGGWQLSTRDMARIGYLILRDGNWNGTQVLPPFFINDLYINQIPGSATLSPDYDDTFYNEHPDNRYQMNSGYSFGFWLPQYTTVFESTSAAEATSMAGAFGTTVHISRDHDLVLAAVETSGDHGGGGISGASLDLFVNAIISDPPPPDPNPPAVSVTAPVNGSTVTGNVTISANATDDIGVAGVQFRVDGVSVGSEDTTAPYGITWNSATVPNNTHSITAVARDAWGNTTTSSPVNITTSNLPIGLVAAYTFDENSGTNASDITGVNPGTVSGAAWTAAGKYGSALSFDGTNDAVSILDSTSLDLTTGMTLEAWVKPTVAPSGFRTVIMKERTGGRAYSLYASGTSQNKPSTVLYINGSNKTLNAGSRLTAGTWTHMAATYDGAKQRLYINGVQVGTRNQTGSITTTTNPLKIGGNSTLGEYFNGVIDDVRVYNRALTQSEIQSDMNNPLVPPAPDTTPPTTNLTTPADGATVQGASVPVSATVTDNAGVTQVEFYRDTTLLATDTTAPYSTNWNTTTIANGQYQLTGKAYDQAGNVGTSPSVTVTVNNPLPDTTAPAVSMTEPADGSAVSGSAATVSADASDNVGVTKVEFYYGGTLISADTTSPHAASWNTTLVPNGQYQLTAKAFDAANNNTTSTPVAVTVNNVDTVAPTVNLTAPADGATVSGNNVIVSATASDNVGVINVEFYYGGTLIASDATSPYSVSWNTTQIANGSYPLTAKAFDAAGNNTTSAARTVTVSNIAVTSFTLINANTDQPIAVFDPLNTGATFSLSSLGTSNLNIRANASGTISSVRFDYDGTTNYRTEGTAPYALAGDTSGDYWPWTPTVGTHTLTATPFASGTSGVPLTVVFTVTN